MILPRATKIRPRPPFLPEALEPPDELVPTWCRIVVMLCLAATAAAYLSGARGATADWAWAPAFAPAFLVLPWRGWRGAALAGGAGILVVIVSGLIGTGHVPMHGVRSVAVATTGVAAAEALRRRRWRAALRDPSTGLPSRRLVEVMLKHEVAAARRGRPLSVVLFGLERVPSSALPVTPERLESMTSLEVRPLPSPESETGESFRLSDPTPATLRVGTVVRKEARTMDILGRYGRDTLLAVLPCEDTQGAVAFARRMRDAAARLATPYGAFPAMSAGIAAFERTTMSEDELLELAGAALDEARQRGGGQIFVRSRQGLFSADESGAPSLRVAH